MRKPQFLDTKTRKYICHMIGLKYFTYLFEKITKRLDNKLMETINSRVHSQKANFDGKKK